jgi:hypothetical protein
MSNRISPSPKSSTLFWDVKDVIMDIIIGRPDFSHLGRKLLMVDNLGSTPYMQYQNLINLEKFQI